MKNTWFLFAVLFVSSSISRSTSTFFAKNQAGICSLEVCEPPNNDICTVAYALKEEFSTEIDNMIVRAISEIC